MVVKHNPVIAAAKEKVTRNLDNVAKQVAIRTLSIVTILLIVTFCIYILAVGACIIWGMSNKYEWRDGYNALLELGKGILLPIVTLVLGFYLGRR